MPRLGPTRVAGRPPVAGRRGLRPTTETHRRKPAALRIAQWEWSKIAALITSIAAIAALFFSAQSLQATQNQIGLTEQGQLTDRFGKAVEQLGSEKPNVRLGGIYALERLAHDSTRDTSTIIEVLSAFIRNNSPVESCPDAAKLGVTHPSADVQAALTVIGRRDISASIRPVDLTRSCLAGAQLDGGDLSKLHLNDSNLSYARLSNVSLADGILDNTALSYATLTNVDARGASLANANLSSATVGNTDFSDTILSDAKFTKADVADSIFVDSVLAGADLASVRLFRDNFTSAVLSGATADLATDMYEPRLSDADLINADLELADPAPSSAISSPDDQSITTLLRRLRQRPLFSSLSDSQLLVKGRAGCDILATNVYGGDSLLNSMKRQGASLYDSHYFLGVTLGAYCPKSLRNAFR